MVNILAAEKLMQQSPKVYATFLLWLLSELFENLPEIGDPEKPKLVFFFDEAHLLFADIEKAVEEKIEQMVRLIRSKGVGVYFVSQNPLDIPDVVLGQLGNRVQHALRAFTPRDQKAVTAAAQTFRQNPKLKVETVLTELAVGEALVSMLDENGARRWSSAPRLFRRAVRLARSHRSNANRSFSHRFSAAITKKRSIANPLSKNYRRKQMSKTDGRRCAVRHAGRINSATSAGIVLRQNFPTNLRAARSQTRQHGGVDGEKCCARSQ